MAICKFENCKTRASYNMEGQKMFWDCTNFNQPLTTWNVDNVIGSYYVFFGCNISKKNKPIFKQ